MKACREVHGRRYDGGPMAPLKATIEMRTPEKFDATGYLGSRVLIHDPKEGEPRQGPGPMEVMLLGVGGCTAVDIVDILSKQRESIDAFRIEIEAERAPKPPRVFTKIRMTYVLRGPRREANVKRAIDLSMEKYCSASIMLKRGGVAIVTSYRIEK